MKWQKVRDLGIGLFKKRNRSRTIWVGTSISITGLFAYLLLLTGMSETHSGDSWCEYNPESGLDECEAYVNITTTYWRICFEEDFTFINTEPYVKTELYVPTYGKKWRDFVPGKDCINRKKINKFKIVGYKEPHQTVKWSFKTTGIDIDPYWYGFNIIKDCKTKTVYDTCDRVIIHYSNYTFINNKTGINISMQDVYNYIEKYNCNPFEVEYDCITLGIETNKIKITCPENTRCDVIGTEWCMLDCADGDCNFDAKQHLEKGWSRSCIDVKDLKQGMEIRVSDFKKSIVKVNKLSVSI